MGSEKPKAELKLKGKTVLTTFGLLSRGKGLEYVIDALPDVVKKFPEVVYLIIGATHPEILKREGQQYRNKLMARVRELKLENHVKFYNRYVELSELLDYLRATDIYISTSLDPNQAVSGTLAYALGAGRPVVSTKFSQALELITPAVGELVDFKNPKAYFRALKKLLSDKPLRDHLGQNAYLSTRTMTWPNVSISYMKIFSGFSKELYSGDRHVPPVKLSHIKKMTDRVGIFQFAKLTEPDPKFGYTLDDNARALMAMCWYFKKFKSSQIKGLMATYLNFISFVARSDGFYDNYVTDKKEFVHERNKKESTGDPSARALLALATAATTAGIPKAVAVKARELFKQSLDKHVSFRYPKSAAFYIKALSLWYQKWPSEAVAETLDDHAGRLMGSFAKHSRKNWQWFERQMSYSNATIPDALLSAYIALGKRNKEYLGTAKKAMDFLIQHTFQEGRYVPIGHRGWFERGGSRAIFDQQPEDVSATVLALSRFFEVTRDARYRDLMHQAFNWFLGDNVLERMVYDESTGGCYDGIGENYINLNQGAESTICYLLARLALM